MYLPNVFATSRMRHNCIRVNITVYLHHLDSNKTLKEKDRWELCKNNARYFKKILRAASYKTAVVRPHNSHLTNHASETS